MSVVLFIILTSLAGVDLVERETFETQAACRQAGQNYMAAYPGKVTGYICRVNGVTAEHQP